MEIRLRLTSNCNLNCVYCFAKTFRASRCGDISLENLKYLLNKCKNDGVITIKVQGGEPTCHKEFTQISAYFKQYGIKAHLYTNGIFDDSLIESIATCYESVIINCNRLDENILDMISININKLLKNDCVVMLGKTLASKDDCIDEFLTFATPFKDRVKLRLDICRPEKYCKSGFQDFRFISKTLVSSLIMANIKGFSVELDCCLPSCFFTKSEWILVRKYLRGFWSKCSTILDIAPDLKVTSCFCGAQFKDLYLSDFDSLIQARYFAEEIENEMRFVVLSSDECKNCIKRINFVCQGGCIGHKNGDKLRYMDKIQLNKFINNEPLDFCEINYNYKFKSNVNTADCCDITKFPVRALNMLLDSKTENEELFKSVIYSCVSEIEKEPENPFMYVYIASQLLKTKNYSAVQGILDRMPDDDNEANNIKYKIIKIMEGQREKIFN
jgi:organic radical activating enzyme